MSVMRGDRYVYVYGGAIGDALLGLHLGRVLAASVPGAVLTMVATRANPLVIDLMRTVPFIEHCVYDKRRITDWGALCSSRFRRTHTVFYEPVTSSIPLWWRIVELFYSVVPGGVHVRYHMKGHEQAVPAHVVSLAYDSLHTNLFATQADILRAWGIENIQVVAPSLSVTRTHNPTQQILFHFFAGQYRRGIPDAHARAILEAARMHFPDYTFVLTCTQTEAVRAQNIAADIPSCNVRIEPTMHELQELLEGTQLCVAVASGIAHIAAHMGVPLVALSNLSDPCWLPTYNPEVTIIAARDECRCNGNKTGDCTVSTPEGDVYRCLYFIATDTVIRAMQNHIS